MPLSLLVAGGVIAGAAVFGPSARGGAHGVQASVSPLVVLNPPGQVTPAAPMSFAPIPAPQQTPSGPGSAAPAPAPAYPPAPLAAPLAGPALPSPPQTPPDPHSNPDHRNLEQSAAGGGADSTAPACPDQAVTVQTQTGTPSYPVGQRPQFRLLITNIGHTACTRNLDPGLRELSHHHHHGHRHSGLVRPRLHHRPLSGPENIATWRSRGVRTALVRADIEPSLRRPPHPGRRGRLPVGRTIRRSVQRTHTVHPHAMKRRGTRGLRTAAPPRPRQALEISRPLTPRESE